MVGEVTRRRIAMLGTRGVPASYGGFETAVEEIGRRLAANGDQVTVYCRQKSAGDSHLGMTLVWRPALPSKSLETLSHTIACLPHLLRRRTRPDVVFFFNSGNALVLPLIKLLRIRVVAHPDGLEWRRDKWSPVIKSLFKLSERLMMHFADVIIADAEALKSFYGDRYGRDSVYIPYGAATPVHDAVLAVEPGSPPRLGYHLIVSRLEPENHVLELVRGYCASGEQLPLVVVGGSSYSKAYEEAVRAAARGDSRVRFLGAVYDQDRLDHLYANAFTYWHGHSVGGTNPSLLRALAGGNPVLAHDNPFNREVAGDAAVYVRTSEDVAAALDTGVLRRHVDSCSRGSIADRTRQRYDWDRVAQAYGLVAGSVPAGRVVP